MERVLGAREDGTAAKRSPAARKPAKGKLSRRHDRSLTYGAIDLGSNNCRLLIARPSRRGGFRVVDAYSRIVRLGEGVAKTGRLNENAMERTIAALQICAERLKRRRVTHLRAVATEACRRSANCEIFVERVRRETGIELEVISNAEEVRLAADGCATLLDPRKGDALLFDIGGGSTEISWLRSRPGKKGARRECTVADWCSLPFGVVNFSERFGGAEVSENLYEEMRAQVRDVALSFEKKHSLGELFAAGELQLLGTSGTVTTLAGMHLALPRYRRDRVDGFSLDLGVMRDISARISRMTYAERVAEGCIGPERADLVIAGCAILEALLDIWPGHSLLVADRGLREGILHLIARAVHRRVNQENYAWAGAL